MTQNELVLDYMERGHKITPLRALEKFGCFRLSARIYDLKQQGHTISDKLVTVRNKTFSQYWIENAEPQISFNL